MTSNLTIVASGDRSIVIRRAFDASARFIFEALTVPTLLKRWLTGPDGWTFDQCDFDLRVGGAYRNVWRNADGRMIEQGGEIREIVPLHRLVQTGLFSGDAPENATVNIIELAEADSQTKLTTTIEFQSAVARDQVINSNMGAGISASYAWLDALAEQRDRT